MSHYNILHKAFKRSMNIKTVFNRKNIIRAALAFAVAAAIAYDTILVPEYNAKYVQIQALDMVRSLNPKAHTACIVSNSFGNDMPDALPYLTTLFSDTMTSISTWMAHLGEPDIGDCRIVNAGAGMLDQRTEIYTRNIFDEGVWVTKPPGLACN